MFATYAGALLWDHLKLRCGLQADGGRKLTMIWDEVQWAMQIAREAVASRPVGMVGNCGGLQPLRSTAARWYDWQLHPGTAHRAPWRLLGIAFNSPCNSVQAAPCGGAMRRRHSPGQAPDNENDMRLTACMRVVFGDVF
jgi:hypothetical protein